MHGTHPLTFGYTALHACLLLAGRGQRIKFKSRRQALSHVLDPFDPPPLPAAAAATFIHALSEQGDLFGYAADLTGGIPSSMVGMVLPGLIYLEATRGIGMSSSVAWYRRGFCVLIALGLVTVFAVPTGVVLGVLAYD